MLRVAHHLRRFAQDEIERNVDRLVVEVRVGDDQTALGVRVADNGEGAALPRTQRLELRQRLRAYREDVALLCFVAPDFARRHAGLLGRHCAQVERPARTTAVHQLGKRIRQATRADVVQREDRIALAQLPAAIDDFLCAPFDFRVAALHRIEVEVGGIRPCRHRRGCTAAHADQQSGPADLDQQRAFRQCVLVRVFGADVAHASGDHDRLVVAAHFARDVLLERAEIAGEIGAPEFVVERGRADRSLEHDGQRRRNAVGLAVVQLPWLRLPGNAQVRNRVADEAGLRLAAGAGGAFVADLATGAGGRTGKRRDRGRVVVRFDLHQDVRRFAPRAVVAVLARIEARDRCAFHHRGIVGIRDDCPLRMRPMCFADQAEQTLVLLHAIDDVLRIEDLVPAVLRIGLREHHELDVGRVAAQRTEAGIEVVDFVRRQRQAHVRIGALERRAARLQQRNSRQRLRRKMREQLNGVGDISQHRLDHPVVQQRKQRRAILGRECRATGRHDAIQDAAFDALDRRETAILRDVGGLRRPRRVRTGTGDHQKRSGRIGGRRRHLRAIRQQAIEGAPLRGTQWARDFDKMPEGRRDAGDVVRGKGGGKALKKLGQPEIRQRRRAGQREDFGHPLGRCA